MYNAEVMIVSRLLCKAHGIKYCRLYKVTLFSTLV